jgi:PP-loop superfamily ATP-utilizing enzyme
MGDERIREGVISALRALGYTYVTVDLMGYRSGSMDEIL